MKRVVFIPPLPLNAFPYKRFAMYIERKSIDEVREFVESAKKLGIPIVGYIRHESTVRLLNQLFGLDLKPSSELYKHGEGDALIVVGLKKPVRGQEIEVKPEDLDLAIAAIVASETSSG